MQVSMAVSDHAKSKTKTKHKNKQTVTWTAGCNCCIPSDYRTYKH